MYVLGQFPLLAMLAPRADLISTQLPVFLSSVIWICYVYLLFYDTTYLMERLEPRYKFNIFLLCNPHLAFHFSK